MDISPPLPDLNIQFNLVLLKTLPVLDDTALRLNQIHGECSAGGHAVRQRACLRSRAARIRRRVLLRYRRHDEDVLLRIGGPAGWGDKPVGSDTEYQDEIRSARRSHSSRRGGKQRYSGDGVESGECDFGCVQTQ